MADRDPDGHEQQQGLKYSLSNAVRQIYELDPQTFVSLLVGSSSTSGRVQALRRACRGGDGLVVLESAGLGGTIAFEN